MFFGDFFFLPSKSKWLLKKSLVILSWSFKLKKGKPCFVFYGFVAVNFLWNSSADKARLIQSFALLKSQAEIEKSTP